MVSIQPFGAFVELIPGKDGLLHISRVAKGRVEKVEDVLNVGDEVEVEVLDIDDRGKVSLDRIDKPDVAEGQPGAPRDRPSRRVRTAAAADPQRRRRWRPTTAGTAAVRPLARTEATCSTTRPSSTTA